MYFCILALPNVPMFEDFKITVFQTVARQGSFTKAASVLGVSQPAVSQNVAELEKQAGVKLFIRDRGAVVLTDQGRILLKYASAFSSLGTSADRLFTRLPDATVRIFTSDDLWNFMLMSLLSDFRSIHPEVSFRRSAFPDADISLTLVPSSMFSRTEGTISKVRVTLSGMPAVAGKLSAVSEKTLTFDLVFVASEVFAGSEVCGVLRGMIADSIVL
ncbi:MAG: LysR family transcriptional regulator [Candidatus Cryptobacteroides sp.]